MFFRLSFFSLLHNWQSIPYESRHPRADPLPRQSRHQYLLFTTTPHRSQQQSHHSTFPYVFKHSARRKILPVIHPIIMFVVTCNFVEIFLQNLILTFARHAHRPQRWRLELFTSIRFRCYEGPSAVTAARVNLAGVTVIITVTNVDRFGQGLYLSKTQIFQIMAYASRVRVASWGQFRQSEDLRNSIRTLIRVTTICRETDILHIHGGREHHES